MEKDTVTQTQFLIHLKITSDILRLEKNTLVSGNVGAEKKSSPGRP